MAIAIAFDDWRSIRTDRVLTPCSVNHATIGDMIVPAEHVESMVAMFERGFAERGSQFAVWGHLSDGNLHPNALPRDLREVTDARQALLEFADQVVGWGGSPLSEHGVGRSELKQRMLHRFLGNAAIEGMRRVKRALDPSGLLNPGVLGLS